MSVIRVQHSFQGNSLQPEDQYVNVFYFQTSLTTDPPVALASAIKNFYAGTGAGGFPALDHFLSGVSDNPGATIKMYDLDDAIPRATVYAETYNPGAHGSGASRNLPDEVALCLSYSAGAASGLPIARRRGRIFVGPFCENALAAGGGVGAESVPNSDLTASMEDAAATLQATADTLGYEWSVWSPTNAAAVGIISWYIDNAWDTQRRRGNKPTSRVTGGV